MRLLELHIDGFGKFHDRTISFNDGINIIYGKNEAGKSTLHTFIRGMLFGIERGRGRAAKNDLYTKVRTVGKQWDLRRLAETGKRWDHLPHRAAVPERK